MNGRSGVACVAITFLAFLVVPLDGRQTVRMPGNPTTPAEQEGRRLFVQRCALCHLPLTPEPRRAYGPLLDGLLKKSSEDKVREAIMVGYGSMPGWQYTLSVEQVNNVIAYLKTFAN